MQPQDSPPPASITIDEILDDEYVTLEEILEAEDTVALECVTFNFRLIDFLSDSENVEQMLRYILEEPPENSDSRRIHLYPRVSNEILTLNVEEILTTIVGEQQLMDLLFSFLEPNHSHEPRLAEYFSQVLICLIHQRPLEIMNYVHRHPDIFSKLVELIGVSSIAKLLVQLFGSNEQYTGCFTIMQWLAQSELLEMVAEKLVGDNSPTVHSNAAEILCAVAGNFKTHLGYKLSNPRFSETLLDRALRDPISKTRLIHTLAVCIALLEPARAAKYSPSLMSFRTQQLRAGPNPAIRKIIQVMLSKLDDLRRLLDTSGDEENLSTTYGELKPPLGRHRLRIVEFISVLMSVGGNLAATELVGSGHIHRAVELFFEYPFNNLLQDRVVAIISFCLLSDDLAVVNHLLRECDLVGKILRAENNLQHADDVDQPTVFSAGRPARAGNVGHITTIANMLVRLGRINGPIGAHLQENPEWMHWQDEVLRQRNAVENVFSWNCGRPAANMGEADMANRDQQEPGEDHHDDDNNNDEAIIPAAPNQEHEDVHDDGLPEPATAPQNRDDSPKRRRCVSLTDPPSDDHDRTEASSSPLKYSRKIILRLAANRGESSSRTEEDSGSREEAETSPAQTSSGPDS